MPTVPLYYYLLPDFELRINGRPLSTALQASVVAVTVDDHVTTPSMFTFVIGAKEDQAGRIPWLEDHKLFAIGDKVVVMLGYDRLQPLIAGEITALEPEFTANSLPRMTVYGYDYGHRLQRGQKTRTFLQQKDSDIVRQIAVAAGLTPRTEDSRIVHDYVIQADQTDWDFLQDRAQCCAYEICLRDKVLFFRPRLGQRSPMVVLSMGTDITEFLPRLTTGGLVSKVSVRGWDVLNKKATTAHATTTAATLKMGGQRNAVAIVRAAFGETEEVLSIPASNQEEAGALAQARLTSLALGFIQAEAVCPGRPDLRAGSSVQIKGVGARFSGIYYILSARHRYADDGYSTQLKLLRGES